VIIGFAAKRSYLIFFYSKNVHLNSSLIPFWNEQEANFVNKLFSSITCSDESKSKKGSVTIRFK
jgi:hypothetical protein